jgi:hypothetical protein
MWEEGERVRKRKRMDSGQLDLAAEEAIFGVTFWS